MGLSYNTVGMYVKYKPGILSSHNAESYGW